MTIILVAMVIGVILGVVGATVKYDRDEDKEVDVIKDASTVAQTTADAIRTSEATKILGLIIAGEAYARYLVGNPYSANELAGLLNRYGAYAGYEVMDQTVAIEALKKAIPQAILRQDVQPSNEAN